MSVARWIQTIPLRLRSLFRRPQVEQELDEEIRYHIERHVEELVSKGVTPEEARYTAMRAFHGVEQSKEACRDARRLNVADSLVRDIRQAFRGMSRNPGHTVVMVL